MRLIDFASLNLRLKDLLGPVTRVKKKKKGLVQPPSVAATSNQK